MIRDDTECTDRLRILFILLAGQLGNGSKDTGKSVGVVNAFNALQRCDRSVKSHAGINIFLRQRFKYAVGDLVVLHKNVVPDLKILAAVAAGLAVRTAGRFACVIEDLGVGTAGSRQSRRTPPIVLLREIYNMRRINAHLHPAVMRNRIARRILVTCKASKEQLVGINAEPIGTGQKLPGICDRFFLEIVTKGPVAEHFKKRAVRGVADLVNIACAYAFLHIGQPLALGVLFTH